MQSSLSKRGGRWLCCHDGRPRAMAGSPDMEGRERPCAARQAAVREAVTSGLAVFIEQVTNS